MPEIQHSAPEAIDVPRQGDISAWDHEDCVKTVRHTGQHT